jgi:hypothetical protein
MKSSEPQNEIVYCDCCKYDTILNHYDYEICSICYWEDDQYGGANKVTLHQAQKNFKEFGACEERFIRDVRKPNENDKREMGQ